MRLSNEQYEFIKGEVVASFKRYNIHCIPISGFEFACKIGILLVPYSSLSKFKQDKVQNLSQDGFFLEDSRGNNIIFYNDDKPYERINMTIIHEIGHCILDHQGTSEEEEAEAAFFAKYAIAPPPLIHQLATINPETIKNKFRISSVAAKFAYNYYQNWLKHEKKGYKEYECNLLKLFKKAS